MQCPGGVRLGAHHRVDALGGERGGGPIVDDGGRVHHRGQRPVLRDRPQRPVELGGVGGVAGQDCGFGSQFGQVGAEPVGAGGVRALPAQQQQAAHPVPGDQVAGEPAAERAGAAGDQHGAAGVQGAGHGQRDLAGVAAALEPVQPFRGRPHRQAGQRRQGQRPLVEQGEEFGEHLGHPVRPGPVEFEGVVDHAGVVRGGPLRVALVGLAELDEPAAAHQQPQ
ncbi:hypothetical protein GCM10009605_57270 [Nocardiopsis composta]